MREMLRLGCMALLVAAGAGCVSTTVEDDGVPVGPRGSFLVVNPAAHAVNELDVQVEAAYQRILDATSTSAVIAGYAEDTHDENDAAVFYLLASGRYYPAGTVPGGFFLSADVGAGRYEYRASGNTRVHFMYGLALGYAFVWNGFLLETGAGGLKADFTEGEQHFVPLLRFQFGRKF